MGNWTIEEEAARLRQRFEGVNKAKFARDHGVPGAGAMIHQHMKGLRPISLECAIAYARGFGVELADISPRLASDVASANQVGRQPAPPAPARANSLTEHLTEIEIAVAALASVLRPAGHDALRKWASGHASASDTAATLDALAVASKALPFQKKANGTNGPLGKAA